MAKKPEIKCCSSAKLFAVLGSTPVHMVYRQKPKVGLAAADALPSVVLDYFYSGSYPVADLFHVQFS